MSRLVALVAVAGVALGVTSAGVRATPPPPPPPPVVVTTAPPTLLPPPTTTAPTTVPATASTVPVTTSTTPERGAATADEDDSWSVRGTATVVAVSVVVLAIAGFVYGRVRSHQRTTATSSALAPTSTNPPPE